MKQHMKIFYAPLIGLFALMLASCAPAGPAPTATPEELSQCILDAANENAIPAAVIIGLMHTEQGQIGDQVLLPDGKTLLGPTRVNFDDLSRWDKQWMRAHHASYRSIRDDGCVNVEAATYLLNYHIQRAGDLFLGLAAYHSSDPVVGKAFAERVMKNLDQMELLEKGGN